MSFFVELIDTLSLVDPVLVPLCGVANHADLVALVDEVAVKDMSAGPTGEMACA